MYIRIFYLRFFFWIQNESHEFKRTKEKKKRLHEIEKLDI
jgi:hypothetical protein